MSKTEEALSWLLKAYEEPLASPNHTPALNTRFRRCLRQHAASSRLQYQQDSAGNIYLTRQGRDPEVPGLALSFPMDDGFSPASFSSAFRVFSSLAREDLLSDLSLLGWTTLQGKVLGQDAWRSSIELNDWQVVVGQKPITAQTLSPELNEFHELPSPSTFPMSAIFEVEKTHAEAIRVTGSPVLVNKARKHSREEVNVGSSTAKTPRAPELRVEGADAEEVALKTICDYSDYCGALFDNFD